MKKIRSLLIMAVFSMILCLGLSTKASAATVNVQLAGTEMYQEALKVYNEMNVQRRNAGLSELHMSEKLMKGAMQRAAECAVNYSHTRPDGRACKTILNDVGFQYKTTGENIAVGFTSAADVMNGWMNSAGHRANILNSAFQAVGVGCFLHNGSYYWVQVFGSSVPAEYTLTKGNAAATATVTLNPADYQFQFSLTNLTSPVVQGVIPVGAKGVLQVAAVNPGSTNRKCVFTPNSFTWSSSNVNVLAFENGYLVGKGAGEAVISAAKASWGTLSATYKAGNLLSTAVISGINATYPYTGRAVVPAVRVQDKAGNLLVKDRDYIVMLENNTWGPIGTITITGINSWMGSVERTFRIVDEEIDATKEAIVTMADRPRGASESVADYLNAVVTVTYRGTVLENGFDYFLKNTQCYNYGKTYSFQIEYRNAYVGYQNCQQIYDELINEIGDQAYTGKAVKPSVTLRIPGGYSVTYKNNVSPGTATAVVKGDGVNLIGEAEKTFRIIKSSSGSSSGSTTGATTVKRKVTFNANRGKSSVSGKTVVSGKKLGTLPSCTRKGYTFTGWYTGKTAGTKVTSSTVIRKNTVLYAHWQKVTVPKTYVIKLKPGSRKMTVTVEKRASARGYQIRYALKSNMQGSRYVYTRSTAKAISGLKKRGKYYVQARAYRLDSSGAKVFGTWSSRKSVRVK